MKCIMSLRSHYQNLQDTVFFALNRGEKEKILTVKIEAPEDEILGYLKKQTIHGKNISTSRR